jgi:tryptophan 2,3-dioxygenase
MNMTSASKKTVYGDYLQLGKLLECQEPYSGSEQKPAHDEMLFIIVHQVYELWFKQIIHDLDSVLDLMAPNPMSEKGLCTVVARLNRIKEIIKLLIAKLDVLETMKPMDFLDFRHFLGTMSGFQSHQFRLLEIKLGLSSCDRVTPSKCPYAKDFTSIQQEKLNATETATSLFSKVQEWLERTPFLENGSFSFKLVYKEAVDSMLKHEKKRIESLTGLTEKEKKMQDLRLNDLSENYGKLANPEIYDQLLREGKRCLSYKSTLAAVFIESYSNEPILHMPHQFLHAALEVDRLLSLWRFRHALMVQKMIGTKGGTGGSLGYAYLIKTVEEYQIFSDFHDLSTLLIPRFLLPDLGSDVKRDLGFFYKTT